MSVGDGTGDTVSIGDDATVGAGAGDTVSVGDGTGDTVSVGDGTGDTVSVGDGATVGAGDTVSTGDGAGPAAGRPGPGTGRAAADVGKPLTVTKEPPTRDGGHAQMPAAHDEQVPAPAEAADAVDVADAGETADAADVADVADAVREEPTWTPYLHVIPPGWPRGVLVGTTLLLSTLVALADLASAWVLVVLPALVAVVVTYHEALHRILHNRPENIPGRAVAGCAGEPADCCGDPTATDDHPGV